MYVDLASRSGFTLLGFLAASSGLLSTSFLCLVGFDSRSGTRSLSHDLLLVLLDLHLQLFRSFSCFLFVLLVLFLLFGQRLYITVKVVLDAQLPKLATLL